MKKILAAMAMLLAVVPFVGAKALNETTNYYSYKKGQVVNFYRNQTSEAEHQGEATESIILEDKGANDKFVKIWYLGSYKASNARPYIFQPNEHPFKSMPASYSPIYDTVVTYLGSTGVQDGGANDPYNYVYTLTDPTMGIDLISVEELIDVFGATINTTTGIYTIPNKTFLNRDEKEVSLYDEFDKFIQIADAAQLEGINNGIWTSTPADKTAGTVYCIKFSKDASGHVNGVTVEPTSTETGSKVYAYVPTLYANKTADCHEEPQPKEYCYKCKEVDGTFKWYILKENDSKIGDVCELEQDSTKCNPKTGSKSHLLEFSIVAALCAISLLVVRRKDLFRTI